jgi:hypothetical protein
MLLEIGNKIATFSKITEMHREKKLEPCGPVRRNLREEKLKELRTRGGFGAMRFPYLAIRQAASQCSGVGDLEEHQPMDVQRGAGQSAGGVEGCKKLKRVTKDFSSVLGLESCFN